VRAADPTATAAMVEALFSELVAAGARHCVVSPGSRSAPLAVAALRCEPLGLRVHAHADERAAAFFALGLAKATGSPALLVCTSGTAAANYLPAIVEAHYAGAPLVAITADRPPELRDWDAGQTIDQVRLFGSHVRWFHELPVPEPGATAERLARAVARRAVATALGPRPGPVHLNWPLREPLLPATPDPPRTAEPARSRVPDRHRAAAPTADEIAALVDLARGEERGVVVAGPLPVHSDLAGPVARFATAAGWPILADPASQLRCGAHVADAPIAAAAELWLRDGTFARAHAPRAVLRLGSAPTSKALRLWLEAAAPAACWLLDPHAHWSDASQLATRRCGADPAALLDAAADALGAPRTSAWCEAFTRAERAAQAALARAIDAEPALLEPRAVRELSALLPGGALLALSNSMPVRDADAFWPCARESLRVLVNRGANGIDGVTSTALGASAAWPGPVVLVTGDLAFLHDLGGLAAARAGGNLTIVLLENGGGGIFSFLPVAEHGEAIGFERLFLTPHGLDLRHAGALFGIPWDRVASWEHFRTAVKAGLATPGVSVVEVPVDRDENVRCFRALARAALEAVAAGSGS
jgi:2-succinyl-5-enolpyruvyl-6-hydroxy-3-cyclohexene-1-carboxylate synthase